MNPIYLDYNASTPVDPAVAAVMRPLLEEGYGNPSSGHWASAPAKAALEEARFPVAALLGCTAADIVFTSGGSEANNLALKGLFYPRGDRSSHIITSQIEHPAILEPCRFLGRLGATVTYVPVDGSGLVDPDDIRRAITRETFLISVMHATTKSARSSRSPRSRGSLASTAFCCIRTPLNRSAGYRPRLTSLAWTCFPSRATRSTRRRELAPFTSAAGIRIEPLIHGAGHEDGRRAGTESALLAAALGKACEIAQSWTDMPDVRRLRDHFWEHLHTVFGNRVVLNGHSEQRLPNTLNVSFIGRIGADILARMPDSPRRPARLAIPGRSRSRRC